MVSSRVPIRYITQSGVVGVWAGGGVGDGGTGGSTGGGGGVDVGDGTVGNGTDDMTGGSTGDGVMGDSVVKAPTALQALWVLALTALTFQ